jgi:hypothetical protein
MTALSGILLIALLIWFWLDSARAREIANGICQEACRARGVQFLDQTVALRRLGLRWTINGVRLRRLYRFDYSCEGVGRQSGSIRMIGIQLETLNLEPACPDNPPQPPQGGKVIPLRRPPPRS